MLNTNTALADNKKYLAGILIISCLLTAVLLVQPLVLKPLGVPLKTMFLVARILFWLCLAVMILYAVKVEKKPFLLWEEKKGDFIFYITSVFALFGILIGVVGAVNILLIKVFHAGETSDKIKQILPLFRANYWMVYLTCITAGVVEELLFRGYLMPRLQVLLKHPAIAIFISTLLFAVMHATYGTIGQVVGPFFIGLIFAIYYYKFRNMKVIIFCHILWDLMAIGAMLMFKK